MTGCRSKPPAYYYESPQSKVVLEALEAAGDRFIEAVNDHLRQLDINTATWGLPLWEARYGLTPAPGASVDHRRSEVKARMRGTGTATIELVQSVADSWKNGEVTVGETAESVILTFVNTMGIPDDINALVRAVRAVVPAHLLIEYDFRYLLVRDVNNTMTLSQLEATPLDHFAGGTYNG